MAKSFYPWHFQPNLNLDTWPSKPPTPRNTTGRLKADHGNFIQYPTFNIMAIVATNLKKGQCIKYEGETGVVLNLEHRTPGKGNALIAATIRSFQTGKTKTIRFASSEKVDIVETDRQKLEFSYSDPAGFHFMDLTTYETITLPTTMMEDHVDYLKEGLEVEVLFIEGNAVTVTLPATVELEVTESSEGLKGDTANNPTKPATLETGKIVQVPLFIKQGDVLKINTEDGSYLGRA
ncbi:elongation factor P [Rubritalea halochordaticola]|uniref:Elongation factor P n=1 Tax=Rubritalea halochordaticola TaxID=714537 RepID=A0ABP9UYT3_9BACT